MHVEELEVSQVVKLMHLVEIVDCLLEVVMLVVMLVVDHQDMIVVVTQWLLGVVI